MRKEGWSQPHTVTKGSQRDEKGGEELASHSHKGMRKGEESASHSHKGRKGGGGGRSQPHEMLTITVTRMKKSFPSLNPHTYTSGKISDRLGEQGSVCFDSCPLTKMDKTLSYSNITKSYCILSNKEI